MGQKDTFADQRIKFKQFLSQFHILISNALLPYFKELYQMYFHPPYWADENLSRKFGINVYLSPACLPTGRPDGSQGRQADVIAVIGQFIGLLQISFRYYKHIN